MMAILGDIDYPETFGERVLYVSAYLLGLFLNAVLISEVAVLVELMTTSPIDVAEREQLREVQLALKYHRVSPDIVKRVMRYYEFAWRAGNAPSLPLDDIAQPLPRKLRMELEVAGLLTKTRRIPFTHHFEGNIVMQLLRGHPKCMTLAPQACRQPR